MRTASLLYFLEVKKIYKLRQNLKLEIIKSVA